MSKLVLCLIFISYAFAGDNHFSMNEINKFSDRDYLWKKNQSLLSQSAKKIRKNILKQVIENQNKLNEQKGGLKLIQWPDEKNLVIKYLMQIMKEERI